MFLSSMLCRMAEHPLMLQVTSLPIQPLVPLVDEFAARLFGETAFLAISRTWPLVVPQIYCLGSFWWTVLVICR